jgi:NTP pyrophosphatase (non-canonical NTP hydrolase)
MPREFVKSAEIISLYDIQEDSNEWRTQAYPDTCGPMYQFMGVAEEVGELSHALLKYLQGIRGYDKDRMLAEVGDAGGDIVIFLCGLFSSLGLDLEQEVNQAWAHVKNRNLRQGSDNGSTSGTYTAPADVDVPAQNNSQQRGDQPKPVCATNCGCSMSDDVKVVSVDDTPINQLNPEQRERLLGMPPVKPSYDAAAHANRIP